MIIGIDAGGTSTRCLLADQQGTPLRRARADGANPVTYGTASAVTTIVGAVQQVCAGRRLGDVRALVIGLAGLEDGDGDLRCRLQSALRAAGLACQAQLVPDSVIVLAAATPATEGTVLISGTGAAAVHIADGRIVRVADGHGWLLGDLGSGMWIGCEAVRAALHHVDSGTWSALATAVLESERVDSDPRLGLHSAVYSNPTHLSELAPVVLDLAARGDADAREIVSRAVTHLRTTLRTARPADGAGPIALTGGVANATVVHSLLLDGIRSDWPGVNIVTVADAAPGAAWLALRALGPAAPEWHGHLTGVAAQVAQ